MSTVIVTDMEAHPDPAVDKKIIDEMGKTPTIWLFVQHACPEMYYSLYMIRLPLEFPDVNSKGFITDPEFITPVLTFPEKTSFLQTPASVTLGSKLYFFGGNHEYMYDNPYREPEEIHYPQDLPYKVQVFDTDRPHLGMLTVSPMKTPKESPCVFVADGMIYALGCASRYFNRTLADYYRKPSGYFERYHPGSDYWEVLPDPPHPYSIEEGAIYLDSATVVGRHVFISSYLRVVFNLDTLDWEPRLPPDFLFPFGSLFAEDTASLYYLRGHCIQKQATVDLPGESVHRRGVLQVVKKGPLTITKEGDTISRSLLNNNCLVSCNERVMAEYTDLDENTFSTEYSNCTWRDLFHMGGRFFCYVVTSQLADLDDLTNFEPNSRGVLIKFFEEVDNSNGDSNNDTKFLPLASFCYKIKTDFSNTSFFTRCSVLGSVPDSWIKAPLKEKQQIMKTKRRGYIEDLTSRDVDAIYLRLNGEKKENDPVEVVSGLISPAMKKIMQPMETKPREDVENREIQESDPMELSSAQDEIRRLKSELAELRSLQMWRSCEVCTREWVKFQNNVEET